MICIVLLLCSLSHLVRGEDDGEIVFDLQELEEHKSKDELLEMLCQRTGTLPPSENARLQQIEARMVQAMKISQGDCDFSVDQFRFFSARRAWCALSARSLVFALAREYASIRQSVEAVQTRARSWKGGTLLTIVITIIMRPQVEREISWLKEEGPAAEILIRQRQTLLKGYVFRSLSNLALNAALANTNVVNGGTPTKEQRKDATRRRLERIQRALDELERRMMMGDASVADVVSYLRSINQNPKSPSLLSNLSFAYDAAKQRYHQCGVFARCKRRAMNQVGKAAARLLLGETWVFREAFMQNLILSVKGCSFDCTLDMKTLSVLGTMKLNEDFGYVRVIQVLFSVYCKSDACLQELKSVGQGLSIMRDAFELQARIVSNFAEPSVALAGIIVVAFVLAALAALVAIGLRWKVLWSRWIWLLLMIGIGLALVGRLYIWAQSYTPVPFDIDARPSLFSVIAMSVGFFARLIMFCLLLLLIHLLVQKRLVSIALLVIGIASTAAVVGIVGYIFGEPRLASRIDAQLNVVRILQTTLLYWIFGPNVVLAGAGLVASSVLCVFFAVSIRSANFGSEVTRMGFSRAFTISVSLLTVFVVMFSISVAQLPVFGLDSQLLFLGVGVILMENMALLMLLLMILNSWWTSRLLDAPKRDKVASSHQSDEELVAKYDSF